MSSSKVKEDCKSGSKSASSNPSSYHSPRLETQELEKLEEENVGTTNELYRLENSLDARIEILAERCRINYDV